MSVRLKKIILAVAFAVLFISMKLTMHSISDEEYANALSYPRLAAGLAFFDITLGSILYSYGTLVDCKKKVLRILLKVSGLINIIGAILLVIGSLIKYFL